VPDAPLRGPTVYGVTDSLPLPPAIEALLTEQNESLPDGRERLVGALGASNLRLLDVLTGGYNSLVLRVESEGETAVLKIPPTRTAVVAEAAALRWWGEELAPKVLHVDEQIGVLLIEQLRPGTAMPWESVADSPAVLPAAAPWHARAGGQLVSAAPPPARACGGELPPVA
jgi:hypothetical protein